MTNLYIGIAVWAVVNIVTFASFWIDKNAAIRRDRSIPEATLLGLALSGGSVGAALGQRLLRHKTVKQPFRSQLFAIKVLHALLAIGAMAVWASPDLSAGMQTLF